MKRKSLVMLVGCCAVAAVIAVAVLRERSSRRETDAPGGPVAAGDDSTSVQAEKAERLAANEAQGPGILGEDDQYVRDIRPDPNLKQIEREILDPALKRQQEQKALQERYESLKEKPQCIHGAINLQGADLSELRPIRLLLRRTNRGAQVAETALTAGGSFAFDSVEPGVYDVVCFERETNPGLRLTDVEVAEGQVLSSLDIGTPTGAIVVRVVNEKGEGLSGAQMTVGKTDDRSGSNPRLFTFRNGTSDAAGRYEATNLTDGDYVVKAAFGQVEASSVITLPPEARIEHTLSIRVSGAQICGRIRRLDADALTSYPIVLDGTDSNGRRVTNGIMTDPTGAFAFSYLDVGDYRVSVQATSQFSGTDTSVKIVDTRQTIRDVVLDVYRPEELATISGTVHGAAASPSPGLTVLVKSASGAMISFGEVDMTSGGFATKKLCPGNYQAVLMSVGASGRPEEVSAKSVSVTSAGANRVDFTLPQK